MFNWIISRRFVSFYLASATLRHIESFLQRTSKVPPLFQFLICSSLAEAKLSFNHFQEEAARPPPSGQVPQLPSTVERDPSTMRPVDDHDDDRWCDQFNVRKDEWGRYILIYQGRDVCVCLSVVQLPLCVSSDPCDSHSCFFFITCICSLKSYTPIHQ